jgi:hypothetical protein
MFEPDVEGLLERYTIEKPHEEFQVAPVTPDPEGLPPSLDKTTFLEPEVPLTQQLREEAARVQELLDLVIETAEPVEVDVPPEDRSFLGDKITAQDYFAAVESDDQQDPNAHRKRHHFELGMLTGCGNNPHWPILASSDLVYLRNTLLNAVDTVEGKILPQAQTSGSAKWTQAALGSHLSDVQREMIVASAQYRFKFAQTVFTMRGSLKGSLLENTLSLALDPQVERIRPLLKEIVGWLRGIRLILCHSQLNLTFEYVQMREALLGMIETAIVDRLINILTVRLSRVASDLVEPVLDKLERGFGNGPIADLISDEVSRDLVTVIGSTMIDLVNRYKLIAAELLKQNAKRRDAMLDKLQFLGERNTVGRWIVHLDQAILVIEKALSEINLSRDIAEQVLVSVLQPPNPTNSKLLDRVSTHPELSTAQSIPFAVRSLDSPDKPLPPLVLAPDNPEGTSPSYGDRNVNP